MHQVQTVDQAVAIAVARYNEVHASRAKEGKAQTHFTEAELRARITQARVKKSASGNSREDRKARKASIAAVQKQLGIQFFISRELNTFVEEVSRTHYDWDEEDNALFNVVEREVKEINPKGGHVIAYRHVATNVPGKLNLEYAIAACHPNDSFDPVLGKEFALKYFNDASKRKVVPFTPTTPYEFFYKQLG